VLSSKASRDWRLRVQDILDAIAKIDRYTQGMDFERFRDDDLVADAVNMNFAVLGEAAAAVPAEIQAKYPAIAWMRNVMVGVEAACPRPVLGTPWP